MTPRGIYEKYRIMPNLQLHQLRVAAIGKYICERFTQSIDERTVVVACLFHDMGNIIKSDLSVFPEFLVEKGVDYWADVKKDFHVTYGDDEHAATLAIMREVGLSDEVIGCVRDMGFSKLVQIVAGGSPELRVVEYSDLRVGPYGVLSLDGRLSEGRKRYLKKKEKEKRATVFAQEGYEALAEAAQELETKLRKASDLMPEDISDEVIAPIIESLWDYPMG